MSRPVAGAHVVPTTSRGDDVCPLVRSVQRSRNGTTTSHTVGESRFLRESWIDATNPPRTSPGGFVADRQSSSEMMPAVSGVAAVGITRTVEPTVMSLASSTTWSLAMMVAGVITKVIGPLGPATVIETPAV